jgi:hypothetical protein
MNVECISTPPLVRQLHTVPLVLKDPDFCLSRERFSEKKHAKGKTRTRFHVDSVDAVNGRQRCNVWLGNGVSQAAGMGLRGLNDRAASCD